VQPEAFPPSMLWGLHGRAAVAAAIRRDRPDVVLATVPPMAAAFAAAPVAARTGVPFVTEFRDLWAGDDYYDAGGTLLTRMEGRALAKADAVICVTAEAADRLAAAHPGLSARVEMLPNGFDPSLLAMRNAAARASAGKLTILHAGALYGGRSIDSLCQALALPQLRGRFRLELMGMADPAELDKLEQAAPDVDLTVEPPAPWEAATGRMAAADVLLVIAAPGHDTAVPGKLYEALALGRPTLVISAPGSATSHLMSALGRDQWSARFGDSESIARVLLRLVDEPFEPLDPEVLEPWNRREVAGRLAGVLDELVEH
jgi:glycosyltransferase involved in cell wall biosynthesis